MGSDLCLKVTLPKLLKRSLIKTFLSQHIIFKEEEGGPEFYC